MILCKSVVHALLLVAISASPPRAAFAQDRLKSMPGYERYRAMRGPIMGSVKLGGLSVIWVDDGRAFEYRKDGKRYRYDIAQNASTDINSSSITRPATPEQSVGRRGRRGMAGPERGRQFASALSPDKKHKAIYRDRNVYLSDPDGKNEIAITSDGSAPTRIKNGTASWVYGEELYQPTAMWWSPDGSKLAFYRFDESRVPDFYLQMKQTTPRSSTDVEAYPLPGDANPLVDLLVYDVGERILTRVDVRNGKPFSDSVVGHYVYHVSWSQDGRWLLFLRANRRQNVVEFVRADPATGKCDKIVREESPASWVQTIPDTQFLKDGNRFIWSSERSGFKNFYLYDLDGTLLATLTNHSFEVAEIVSLDEEHHRLLYTAHDGDNPIKLQLHRLNLDGTNDVRLTDPAFHHTVDVAPDGAHFIDVAQTHDTPPLTRLIDADGKMLAELDKADTSKFDELGLKKVELFTFKAADGATELHGLLHRPSHFDPAKKYPLLVTIYAGPDTNAARETFTLPNPLTEYGFLVASFDSRSAAGFGKKFTDAIYKNFGQTEIDDQAAGVHSLYDRPYFDKTRVGIFGTSYGGYASAMCLLRYPDVFAAACSSSPVTDWHDYDSIYTERYMGLLDDNKPGYAAGSLMTYAKNLKGRLMLYYGTADNNVHPNNMMQLIAALQRAGKSFDVQAGPDRGHSGINQDRMMEFFVENLVLDSHENAVSGSSN
jgi:dipeptidyl-peptidase-4